MRIILIFVLFLSPFAASRAEAARYSANGVELYSLCMASEDDEEYAEKMNACAGFIVGAIDTAVMFQEMGLVPNALCLPENLTDEELMELVVAYLEDNLEDNPDFRQTPAATLVLLAVNSRYGCK